MSGQNPVAEKRGSLKFGGEPAAWVSEPKRMKKAFVQARTWPDTEQNKGVST